MDENNRMHSCETCGCACAAPSQRLEPRPLPDDPNRLKWWLELSRRQTAKLWEVLPDYLDNEKLTEILVRLGRNCAENLGWAKQYIGDPEGFFRLIFDRYGETISYDRDAQVITVVTRERDCDCLLVNSGNISPAYCACSIGWQQYTYETILKKRVRVDVVKSVIGGDRNCEFRITVLDEDIAGA